MFDVLHWRFDKNVKTIVLTFSDVIVHNSIVVDIFFTEL